MSLSDYTKEERCWLWLGIALKANAKAFLRFVKAFGTPENIFEIAQAKQLKPVIATDDGNIERMQKTAKTSYIDACIEKLNKLNIKFSAGISDNYPELLKEIYDPPSVLYYKGTLNAQPKLPIAMIGSRKHTDYGASMAKTLSFELAEQGVTIISGMAIGLDGICARGAMECKTNSYPTIAVLGSGVDVIYPHQNAKLYHEIIERGTVISEFLPGTGPERGNFPERNRLISGMAKGVVVIEAGTKSGTSITVSNALDQGRDVFALPGRVTDTSSVGTNQYIKEGYAKMVLGANDILEEYLDRLPLNKNTNSIDISTWAEEPALVYKLLQTGEKSFDDLCQITGINAQLLNSTLTSLEFSGIIKQLPGRVYSL